MLTGRPPFQEETHVKMALAHINQEPPSLADLRSDAPPALVEILAKMLAKNPAERYQTPVELVQALLPFIKTGGKIIAPPPVPELRSPTTGTVVGRDTSHPPTPVKKGEPVAANPFDGIDAEQSVSPRTATKRKPRLLLGGIAAAIGLLFVIGVTAAIVLTVKTKDGVIELTVDQKDAEVYVDGERITVAIRGDKEPIEILKKPGVHKLEVRKGGFKVESHDVTVTADGHSPVNVRLVAEKTNDAGKPPVAVVGNALGDKIPAFEHLGNKWKIEGSELRQESADHFGMLVFGDASWTDYDLTVDAQRISGEALCWIVFRCVDLPNRYDFKIGNAGGKGQSVHSRVDGRPNPLGLEGWVADDEWHKIGVQVRGTHIECFVDAERVFRVDDLRHRNGYVGLLTLRTATRFRNLKVTDARGGILVAGIHQLVIAGPETVIPINDRVRPGTVWKGKLARKSGGIDLPDWDLKIKILKRQGTNFEGEFWTNNQSTGMKIKGKRRP